jgi:hypothetical protein
MCHIYFISQFAQFAFLSAFFEFLGFLKLFVSHSVTVSQCGKFIDVTFVKHVTLVTNINIM